MNRFWNIILAIIAAILLAWFYTLNQPQPLQLASDLNAPEYIGKNMRTTVYSPNGSIQYVASATTVKYYAKTEQTIFEKPLVYIYEMNNGQILKSWVLKADKAILNKKNDLLLNGNVRIQNLTPNAKLEKIETEQAEVNLTTQEITSDTIASIIGQNFVTSGKKLIGNLRTKTAILKKQVKTSYEIKP
ncbi:LPS export ABC transporter periplasmic protein LptC [Mergibacter septicus]|uniref:LPS export ABC transporter periplasmic protein LptC n=1 Tax=Mergibacter septicus TaxID=221402 RepID=UPI0011796E34|nr:LPS export ABC transporter periplasmic protein LptC [Mergibacter septicus]AWX14449.1 LPS export ABC transporter periplasmic protein LptC [Mergibacter septicus]